jgi:hypothetical protein
MPRAYKDVQRCPTHGLALSSDGSCLRCARVKAGRERRARAVPRAIAAAVLTLFAFAAALFFSLDRPDVVDPPARIASKPFLRQSDDLGVEAFGPGTARVTSPATHAVLASWQAQLARAEAKEKAGRVAEAREVEARRQAIWRNLGPTPVAPPAAPATVVAAAPPRQLLVRHQPHESRWSLPTPTSPVRVTSGVAVPRTAALPQIEPTADPPPHAPPACPGGKTPDGLRRLVAQRHAPPPAPVITEGSPGGSSI